MVEMNRQNHAISERKKIVCTGGSITAFFALTLLLIFLSYYFVDIPVAIFCRQIDPNILQVFDWITELGISTWYLVVSLFLFLIFRFYRKNRVNANRALFVFAAVGLSGIAAIVLKPTVARCRPKIFFEKGLYGFDFFKGGYDYNSFPSGHAVTIFSLATAMSLFWPKYRVYFFVVAFAVALSRIVLTSHFVGDVIAGAFIGSLTALLLNKYIPDRFSIQERPSDNSLLE
jgi:membrane-associated phospholipid phosphatase